MQLRILMAGNDQNYLDIDRLSLREKGFKVYTTTRIDNLPELVSELKPSLIFINFQSPTDKHIELYNEMLDNLHFAALPLIFTLSEDDVYLISRKRTASKEKRNAIADNIMHAIKLAFNNTKPLEKYSIPLHKTLDNYNFQARA